MSRTFFKLFLFCVLVFGVFGLSACAADEPDESETTEASTDEPATDGLDDPLVGTWESEDAYYFATITLAEGGAGTGFETEDSEVDIVWTYEDDYLEFEYGSGSVLGGGFEWTTEGEEFVWDAGGIYTRAE